MITFAVTGQRVTQHTVTYTNFDMLEYLTQVPKDENTRLDCSRLQDEIASARESVEGYDTKE